MKTPKLDKIIGKTQEEKLTYVINSLKEENDILRENLKKEDKIELHLSEIKGWIFIGEIEFKYSPFSKYIDDEPVFMYARSHTNEEKTKVYYTYGFSRGIICPEHLSYFELEKRYSITTILQFYISHDIECLGADGRYIMPANRQAFRLAGMTEWILPNDKFLNKEIELDDLEKLWRTDKEKKKIDEYQSNRYASNEDKKKALDQGFYKV